MPYYPQLVQPSLDNTFYGQQTFIGQYFSPLVEHGPAGATPEIDWNLGNQHSFELSAPATFTFSNPATDGRYVLLLKNNGSSVVWPASVAWPGNVPPVLSASGTTDLFTFMYIASASKYIGAYSLGYHL